MNSAQLIGSCSGIEKRRGEEQISDLTGEHFSRQKTERRLIANCREDVMFSKSEWM